MCYFLGMKIRNAFNKNTLIIFSILGYSGYTITNEILSGTQVEKDKEQAQRIAKLAFNSIREMHRSNKYIDINNLSPIDIAAIAIIVRLRLQDTPLEIEYTQIVREKPQISKIRNNSRIVNWVSDNNNKFNKINKLTGNENRTIIKVWNEAQCLDKIENFTDIKHEYSQNYFDNGVMNKIMTNLTKSQTSCLTYSMKHNN